MKPRFSPSCHRSCVKIADRSASRRHPLKNKLGDRMIKQLLNSVVAKYRDLSVSRRSIICWSRRLRQIIDLLATDKSRYFAQPRPITANYSHFIYNQTGSHACVPVDNRVWFALSLYGVCFPSPSQYFGDVSEENHVTLKALIARNNEG